MPSWGELPDSAQDALLEAESRFRSGQAHDYAPVVVGFAKAVEVTFKRQVFDQFRRACEATIDVSLQIEFALNDRFRKAHKFVWFVHKGNHIELGAMAFALRLCKGETARKLELLAMFRGFLCETIGMQSLTDDSTIDEIDALSKLRNPGAHEVAYDRDTAAEARRLAFSVLGSIPRRPPAVD